jgi:hypothetical protein
MRNFLKRLVVLFYAMRVKIMLNRKIAKIYTGLPNKYNLAKSKIKEHYKIWSASSIKPNLKWYKVFASVNGIDDPRYVTEIHYYNFIEPVLNNKGFSEAYSDKNVYHKILDHSLLPAIYLRSIHGSYYDESYCPVSFEEAINKIPLNVNKIITKQATDSGGGRGIFLFERTGDKWLDSPNEVLTSNWVTTMYKTNFLVQEYVDQYAYFSQFNQSSVNTVRLLTYRSVSDNKIIPLHAVLRIGKPGMVVDNQASGGISCGIGNGGVLNHFAVDKNGNKYSEINSVSFAEAPPVQNFEEILAIGLQLAPIFVHHRLLGFDFCVDSFGNVKLIEVNSKNNETNFFQMNNGPLFGDYTDEIIDYCRSNRRSFCFDFYL